MTAQDQEFQELFNTVTVPIPGSPEIHAITLNGFKLVAERLLQIGYQRGFQQSQQITEDTLAQVLNY